MDGLRLKETAPIPPIPIRFIAIPMAQEVARVVQSQVVHSLIQDQQTIQLHIPATIFILIIAATGLTAYRFRDLQ